MVDDILCVQRCSKDTVQINALVNAFIEGKKLKLGDRTCPRIHVKNKKTINKLKCPEVKVHENQSMRQSRRSFLGTLLTPVEALLKLWKKAEILTLLDEIPGTE